MIPVSTLPLVFAPTFQNAVEGEESILCVPQDEGQEKWGDSMPFEFRCDVRHGCALSFTLFNCIIPWSLSKAIQNHPGVQFGATTLVSDLAYVDVDGILILRSGYWEMQGLFEAVNLHAAAVGMRINVRKTKVMSALIPGEHLQAALLDAELLYDVDKFKYLGSMLAADGLDS